jgi:hypothetical protein
VLLARRTLVSRLAGRPGPVRRRASRRASAARRQRSPPGRLARGRRILGRREFAPVVDGSRHFRPPWLGRLRHRSSCIGAGLFGSPVVFFADLDVDTLRRQKAADLTRTRSRHETHILIAPALKCWYRAMPALDPVRVEFRLPVEGVEARLLRLGQRAAGSGSALFDRFMCELEGIRTS